MGLEETPGVRVSPELELIATRLPLLLPDSNRAVSVAFERLVGEGEVAVIILLKVRHEGRDRFAHLPAVGAVRSLTTHRARLNSKRRIGVAVMAADQIGRGAGGVVSVRPVGVSDSVTIVQRRVGAPVNVVVSTAAVVVRAWYFGGRVGKDLEGARARVF